MITPNSIANFACLRHKAHRKCIAKYMRSDHARNTQYLCPQRCSTVWGWCFYLETTFIQIKFIHFIKYNSLRSIVISWIIFIDSWPKILEFFPFFSWDLVPTVIIINLFFLGQELAKKLIISFQIKRLASLLRRELKCHEFNI